jgi:hypothetical protein
LRRFAVLAGSFFLACAPASPPLPAETITPGCSVVLTGAISNGFDCRVFAGQDGSPGIVLQTEIRISFATRDVRAELDITLDGPLQPGAVPTQAFHGGEVSSFGGPTWSSQAAPGPPSLVITAAVPVRNTFGDPLYHTEFSVHGNATATYVSDNGTSGTVTANFTF